MKPIIILFLIVFIDLVGFGLLIPLLPFYVQRVGAGPEIITITLGLYSLFQFIAAPIWGKLSDRYGRKPVLAWSLAGFAVSYVMLAYADTLAMVIASRVFGGLMAGNISAAFAYVTDITTEDTRAKGMGLLGAAFGLGFIFGPVIGGVLAGTDVETANYVLPALFAAGLTVLAFLGVLVALPESLSEEVRQRIRDRPKVPWLTQFRLVMTRRAIALITVTAFVVTMAFALLEVTLALWANAVVALGPRDIGLVLAYVGIIGVVIQGGLIGPLTKRYAETGLMIVAILSFLCGYAGLVITTNWAMLMLSMTLIAVGSGISNPVLSSLVSKQADETERGVVIGLYQSAGSLARVIGPLYAGVVFANFGAPAPFALAAVFMVPAVIMVLALPKAHPA